MIARSLLLFLGGCAPAAIDLGDDTADTGDPAETGDTGVAAEPCGRAPVVAARYEVGTNQALEVRVSPGAGRVEAGDVAASFRVTSVGAAPVAGTWAGCGYPTWTITDDAGAAVWAYTVDGEVQCDTADFTFPPGEGFGDNAILPDLPAGTYRLTVTTSAAIGGDKVVPYNASTELVVGGTSCASGAGSARWPDGLTLWVEPGPPDWSAAEDHSVAGGGVPDVGLRTGWYNCLYPTFDLWNRQGGEPLWHYSVGDQVECGLIEGWPAGEEHADRAVVDAGLLGDVDALFSVTFVATAGDGGTRRTYTLASEVDVRWPED